LLYEACKEAKAKDSDIRQQVRRIGNQFLSHVEIGAQEAAYLVLQMPLRRSSRDVVFIDTNKQENRTILLKPFSDLKEMLESSTNVESDSAFKRYKRRPREMNKYCYADFVSWFEPVFLNKKGKQMKSVDSELPEDDYSHDPLDEEDGESENLDAFSDNVFELKDGTVLRKRRKQKVLRYHKASLNDDTEEYYRQILMLFTAWRNEDVDLLKGCKTYEESYKCILSKKL